MTILEKLSKHTFNKKDFIRRLGCAIEDCKGNKMTMTKACKKWRLHYSDLNRAMQFMKSAKTYNTEIITRQSSINNEDVTHEQLLNQ